MQISIHRIRTSPSRTVRLTPLRIGCFDSEMTAERSLTSSNGFRYPSSRSVEEDAGDSTATEDLTTRNRRRAGGKRRRWGWMADTVNSREFEVENLRETSWGVTRAMAKWKTELPNGSATSGRRRRRKLMGQLGRQSRSNWAQSPNVIILAQGIGLK